MATRTLVRSRDHRVIAGVCGGIAEYFEVDPTLVRVATALGALFSAGLVCGAYLVAWLVLPDQSSGDTGADQLYDRYGNYKRRRDERAAGEQGPSDSFRAD